MKVVLVVALLRNSKKGEKALKNISQPLYDIFAFKID